MYAQLGAIVLLLILSGIFSATETAYTSLSIIQKKAMESRKGRSAKIACKLSQNPDLLLTTILVGNNVVNISASSLVTTFTIQAFGNQFVGIATGLLTVLVLMFGEITPKQLALCYNVNIAIAMAYPVRFLTIVLFPIIWLFKTVSKGVTRLFSRKEQNQMSVEGIMHVMDVAEDEGIVDEYESDLVQRVLHFSETQVKTIMTHRTEVFKVSDQLTLKEAFPAIVASGYSRIPVYSDTPEEITGILLLRDLLNAQVEGRVEEPISHFVHEPIFVPETRHVDDMFFQFKRDKLQIAIVLDEYGGLSGVVTMEDVAEQLFGELYDEHETGEAERIKESEACPGSYLVQADTPFQQLVDELDISWPHAEKVGTVAAYLMELTGTIPVEGDVLESPIGSFRILSMKGKRVEQVEFTPHEDEEE